MALLPINTHWIPSLVTGGTGSFTTVKEMVTGSPILIDLLVTPAEGDTSGGTAEERTFKTLQYTNSYNKYEMRLLFKFYVVSSNSTFRPHLPRW